MLDHGLLDELHVWLHPLLVGDTDPHNHIGAVGAASRWQLDDVRRHDSGLTVSMPGDTCPQACDS